MLSSTVPPLKKDVLHKETDFRLNIKDVVDPNSQKHFTT